MTTHTETTCLADQHGTHQAYDAGCCCPEALIAKRGYRKRLQLGIQPPAFVPTIGSRRRIQALQAIGYSRKHLATYLGYAAPTHRSLSPVFFREKHHRDLAHRIATLYEHLSMEPGPSSSARIRARKRGYAPPLAWDEGTIDDPSATAHTAEAVAHPDKVIVERAIAGELASRDLAAIDRDAAIRAMRARNWSITAIATQLQTAHHVVNKALRAEDPAA